MEILLHTCCGPCTTYSRLSLEEDGHEVHGFFYNPNIHPYREYQMRLDTLRDYAQRTGMPLTVEDDYDLEGFLQQVVGRGNERCRYCYAMRLDRVAKAAHDMGFSHFSTTLLISPYQNHEAIKEMALRAAESHGVEFYYKDFRPGYRESVRISKEMGLYRQPYCGCIFSERDRYQKARREPGDGAAYRGRWTL